MNLTQAEEILSRFLPHIEQAAERLLVCGSIRRKCPTVGDADIVLIPKTANSLGFAIHEMNVRKLITIEKNGPLIKVVHFEGLQIDLYVATPNTWGTLMLIRTGSKEHNIALCTRARRLGFELKADGSGLLDVAQNKLIPINHEVEVFERLGISFLDPGGRR